MATKICDSKGHDYSTWRKILGNRVNCDLRGISYGVEQFNYYVRNCKCCGKVQAASSEAEMGMKNKESNKIHTLSLSKK